MKGGFEISIEDPDKSLPFIQNTINEIVLFDFVPFEKKKELEEALTKLSGKDFDLSDDRKYPWVKRTYGFLPVFIERFEGVSDIINKIRIDTVSVTGIAYNIIIRGFIDTEKFIELRQRNYEPNTKPRFSLSHSGLDVLKKAERDLANFCQKNLPMGIIRSISGDYENNKNFNPPSLWIYLRIGKYKRFFFSGI